VGETGKEFDIPLAQNIDGENFAKFCGPFSKVIPTNILTNGIVSFISLLGRSCQSVHQYSFRHKSTSLSFQWFVLYGVLSVSIINGYHTKMMDFCNFNHLFIMDITSLLIARLKDCCQL